MILPGRGLLGNRSHAWLDTVASFGLEYERALGPAGHLKDEAGWLGVNWLRGLRSTQEAVVRPSRACRSPRCHRRGDRTRPRVGPAPSRSQVRAFLLRMIAVRPVGRAPPAQSLPAPPRRIAPGVMAGPRKRRHSRVGFDHTHWINSRARSVMHASNSRFLRMCKSSKSFQSGSSSAGMDSARYKSRSRTTERTLSVVGGMMA